MIDGLSAFFLICFGVGAVMTLLAVLSGVGHASLHGPHLHLDGHAHGPAANAGGASVFNVFSALVFLNWFGGVGFLLHGPFGVLGVASLVAAGLAGVAGAVAVYEFLVRVLAPQSVPLDPDNFRLEGQVGRVPMPVRAGGVCEVKLRQNGRRRAVGARCAAGASLERGTEVVIVAIEHGLATVEPWDQFVAARPPSSPPGSIGAPPSGKGEAES